MNTPNPHPSGPARLKSLLKAAGLKSFRLDATRRALMYFGRTREWVIIVRLDDQWLHAYTVFCDVPREAGLRARLFEATLKANAAGMLAKFGLTSQLILELEYRAEHLEPSVLGNLIGFLHTMAEEHYPKIFRIVSGDETLDALAEKLNIQEAAS